MIEVESRTYHFLDGGEEMGELTRNYDWSSTPVGPVDQWPQSLRTMVDVILHSHTPMFLWWGEDLIQFYNDAYRPSFGQNGKHPAALGQRAADCWPEIWHIIQPLIETVRQGGAVWLEDELIPSCRNGQLEDIYWTFGYSPVRDESGEIAGVLVVCNEKTKQIKTLQKIEESERMMSSIVLHAPVAICILEGETLQAKVVNDLFLQLAGKTRENFVSKPYREIFPEFKDTYALLLDSVALTGEPFREKEQKLTVIRNGGKETIYVDIVVEPMRSVKDSTDRKIMILAIDVTDKVLARQKIEESEQRYRTLITESTVAIALYVGAEVRIQYVNELMIRYWGKDESVVGKTLLEAVPELNDQPFPGRLEHAYRTGKSYVGTEEEAFLEVDGKLQSFYFNYIYKPLKDADGNVYAIHHMAMDVTEQVLARKKVEQSERILRNIILKAPVAMCILKGPEFVVEIANDLMYRIWGKPRELMLNQPIFKGLPEVRHQGFEEILERVYSTGESFSADAVLISLPREGSIEKVYINFLYEAYREADGTISGVMAVATDVTEQVKARQRVEELVNDRTQELAESNKNLQRSNDELAQFAYIASHDLQEPARKISTFTEMLQSAVTDADPRTKTLLQKIEHSSARMLSLIRDILGYSQLSKEQQRPLKIDLNQVIESIRDDFELLIEEKEATIVADSLPVIEGIPVQINQLFSNLISNGLKFAHKQRTPVISIMVLRLATSEIKKHPELNPEMNYFKISIQDNGIGFNQRNARQIFDIFQRLHGKNEYEGTGIGLAMCRKIALNHHGDIYAESTEGVGATFHVILPESQ